MYVAKATTADFCVNAHSKSPHSQAVQTSVVVHATWEAVSGNPSWDNSKLRSLWKARLDICIPDGPYAPDIVDDMRSLSLRVAPSPPAGGAPRAVGHFFGLAVTAG